MKPKPSMKGGVQINRMVKIYVFPTKSLESFSNLKSMQSVVGGYIQAYYPWLEEVVIVCNDEGKINGMPLNRPAFGERGELWFIY